jgi:hypothetical protein
MKSPKNLMISFLLLVTLIGCTEKKDDNSALIAALVVASRVSSNSCTVTPAPSFSTLAAAGTQNTTNPGCAQSGCHTTAAQSGGMDISSYSSVKARVIAGNSAFSTLYNKVSAGNMSGYTSSAITAAIKSWIDCGANP